VAWAVKADGMPPAPPFAGSRAPTATGRKPRSRPTPGHSRRVAFLDTRDRTVIAGPALLVVGHGPATPNPAASLADADDLAQLTLARLAAALGVRTPSLYAHVDGLGDLRAPFIV